MQVVGVQEESQSQLDAFDLDSSMVCFLASLFNGLLFGMDGINNIAFDDLNIINNII